MKYRSLRTTLCLLLIALWVRSCYRADLIEVRQHSISSLRGRVGIDERVMVFSGVAKRDVRLYFNGQVIVTSVDAAACGSRNGGTVIHYAYLLDALIGTTALGLIARAAKYLNPTT